ncbi:hypothetical protein DENSPDRAFT_886098 [Dentipellis sp. KUC8613]|nr:hypothetical protein DENSPDRAFT_886098 [Dentipellis sp. KUC8613]
MRKLFCTLGFTTSMQSPSAPSHGKRNDGGAPLPLHPLRCLEQTPLALLVALVPPVPSSNSLVFARAALVHPVLPLFPSCHPLAPPAALLPPSRCPPAALLPPSCHPPAALPPPSVLPALPSRASCAALASSAPPPPPQHDLVVPLACPHKPPGPLTLPSPALAVPSSCLPPQRPSLLCPRVSHVPPAHPSASVPSVPVPLAPPPAAPLNALVPLVRPSHHCLAPSAALKQTPRALPSCPCAHVPPLYPSRGPRAAISLLTRPSRRCLTPPATITLPLLPPPMPSLHGLVHVHTTLVPLARPSCCSQCPCAAVLPLTPPSHHPPAPPAAHAILEQPRARTCTHVHVRAALVRPAPPSHLSRRPLASPAALLPLLPPSCCPSASCAALVHTTPPSCPSHHPLVLTCMRTMLLNDGKAVDVGNEDVEHVDECLSGGNSPMPIYVDVSMDLLDGLKGAVEEVLAELLAAGMQPLL